MRKSITLLVVVFLALGGFALGQVVLSSPLDDSKFYLSLGDFLMAQGHEDGALKAYEKALELDSNSKAALNNIGYYYRERNPLLAIDYFDRAIALDPMYETARNNIAFVYNKNGFYSDAAEHLSMLVSISPGNIGYKYDLAINLANKYYHQTRHVEDLDSAISHFRKVHELSPGYDHTLENIKVLEEIRRML